VNSPLLVEVRLPEDQLVKLASLIASKTGGRGAESDRPYTVEEAARALGLSGDTIRRRVKAGLLPKVPNMGRTLIPACEIDRLRNPDGGNGR
jgi:excisionase family DNA binding protein